MKRIYRSAEGEAKKIRSRASHDGGKLSEANNAIAISVSLSDHLCELSVRERLPHFGHGPGQLRRRYETIAVAIEVLEHP